MMGIVLVLSGTLVVRSLAAHPITPGTRPGAARTSDSTDALAALSRFHTALAAGDSAAALALLATDVTILEGGEIQNRSDYAAHHLMADIAYARAVHSTYTPGRVVVSGDVAWITSTSVSQGEMHGRVMNSIGAELGVLSRGTAGWQLRSIHWSSHARRRGE